MFSKFFKRAPSQIKSFLVKDGKPKFDPQRKGYVILCYHSIGVKQEYRYTTMVENFEEQLAYLRKFFKLVTLKEIVEKVKSGDAFSGIEVAVTFDDGFRDNHTHALPLLTKYHVPATIFINTAMAQTGYRTFLNWEQIRAMAEHPLVSFESHGCTHSPLTALEREDVLHEMMFSKKELESRTHKPVDIFSYPFGIFNEHVVEMAKEAGYHAACCAGVDLGRGRDLWRMNRLVVDESHANLDHFAYELTEEVTVI